MISVVQEKEKRGDKQNNIYYVCSSLIYIMGLECCCRIYSPYKSRLQGELSFFILSAAVYNPTGCQGKYIK